MKKYLKEFQKFAVKGNVVDLAVAVIIGGAFGKIVSSLVADIIMPIIGSLVGGVDFTSWKIILKQPIMKAEEIINPAITLNIGIFLQNIFDFLIIAFSIFMMVKILARLKKKLTKREEEEKEEIVAPVTPTKDQELLSEIRDLLKNKS